MRQRAFMARDGFARLRRRISEIEARGAPELAAAGGLAEGPADGVAPPLLSPRRAGLILPFAIPEVDRLLAGGLRRDALHELRSSESRNAAAATGFAGALLALLAAADDRPVLWIVEAATASEAGFIHGRGLNAFGVDPRRLIIVRLRGVRDALWVFEEGLCCSGLAAVVCEIRGSPSLLDLTASRRLALRAREHGIMGILLRQAAAVAPGAAMTRWHVAPRPAAAHPDDPAGIGRPVWRLTLERNRAGATGAFDLEWDHDGQHFAFPAAPVETAHPVSVVPLPRDRPALSPDAGKIVALRPAAERQPGLLPREIRRRQRRAR